MYSTTDQRRLSCQLVLDRNNNCIHVCFRSRRSSKRHSVTANNEEKEHNVTTEVSLPASCPQSKPESEPSQPESQTLQSPSRPPSQPPSRPPSVPIKIPPELDSHNYAKSPDMEV